MIKLITMPTVEPVTLLEAKQQCRVDHTDDDSYIEGLIANARSACEDYTLTSFLTQSWDLVLDEAGYYIDLPRPPLQSVTGVYVTDDDGVESTVDPASYRVDNVSTPGRILLKPGYSWPLYTARMGFRIRYTAGYTTANLVPRPIKKAILMLVAYLYDNPGDTRGTATASRLPDDVKTLLDPYKVYY